MHIVIYLKTMLFEFTSHFTLSPIPYSYPYLTFVCTEDRNDDKHGWWRAYQGEEVGDSLFGQVGTGSIIDFEKHSKEIEFFSS